LRGQTVASQGKERRSRKVEMLQEGLVSTRSKRRGRAWKGTVRASAEKIPIGFIKIGREETANTKNGLALAGRKERSSTRYSPGGGPAEKKSNFKSKRKKGRNRAPGEEWRWLDEEEERVETHKVSVYGAKGGRNQQQRKKKGETCQKPKITKSDDHGKKKRRERDIIVSLRIKKKKIG